MVELLDFNPRTIDMQALHVGEGRLYQEALDAIDDSLRRTGFLTFDEIIGSKDTQIDEGLVDRMLSLSQQFFALQEEAKLAYFDEHIGGQRGYTPFGREKAEGRKTFDLKEFLHFGPESLIQNIPITAVTGLDETAMGFFYGVKKQGDVFYRGVAEVCGFAPDFFHRLFREGLGNERNSVLRILHYAGETDSRVQDYLAAAAELGEEPVRAAGHKDINMFTFLLAAEGLEIKPNGSERYVPVKVRGKQFVGNTGQNMETMSGGIFPATLHQVVGFGQGSRYTAPVFDHPTALRDQGLPLLFNGKEQQAFYNGRGLQIYGSRAFEGMNQEEVEKFGRSSAQIGYLHALNDRLWQMELIPSVSHKGSVPKDMYVPREFQRAA